MLTQKGCPGNMLAIRDALETVDGKRKLLILIALSRGAKRFNELAKEVTGISDKMLSKELRPLWVSRLVKRDVNDVPATIVEYSITSHGK